ncbi:hypothetical protein GTW37_27935 [Streptomyces sp. SID4931]|nr:hypothetical protein [Streptomyces sp. SID4931]
MRRTRRHRRLLGERLDADPEYDRVYEEAGLAMTLGTVADGDEPTVTIVAPAA